jgi:hypothetical protein
MRHTLVLPICLFALVAFPLSGDERGRNRRIQGYTEVAFGAGSPDYRYDPGTDRSCWNCGDWKDSKEWEKARREARRERQKDLREAEKDRREAVREWDKAEREAWREEQKARAEWLREREKADREASREWYKGRRKN